jgi:rubredoxin
MAFRHYWVKEPNEVHLENRKCPKCNAEKTYFIWEDILPVGTLCGYKCPVCNKEFTIRF